MFQSLKNPASKAKKLALKACAAVAAIGAALLGSTAHAEGTGSIVTVDAATGSVTADFTPLKTTIFGIWSNGAGFIMSIVLIGIVIAVVVYVAKKGGKGK